MQVIVGYGLPLSLQGIGLWIGALPSIRKRGDAVVFDQKHVPDDQERQQARQNGRVDIGQAGQERCVDGEVALSTVPVKKRAVTRDSRSTPMTQFISLGRLYEAE